VVSRERRFAECVGGGLRLHDGCTPSNTNCTFTWQSGSIVSDADDTPTGGTLPGKPHVVRFY
jgi:hypothetical protein